MKKVTTDEKLAIYMESKDYASAWELVRKDLLTLRLLLAVAPSEVSVLQLLNQYAPEPEEVWDEDFTFVCENLLVPAYKKGYYRLIGWIYACGYDSLTDPLCKGRFPLFFAALENSRSFAYELIAAQQQFNTLTFDGECTSSDGVSRNLLESLVLWGNTDFVALCLNHGANPNTFSYWGEGRLLDLAKSEEMRRLLLIHGAVPSTERERTLIRTVRELQHGCLQVETEAMLFSREPLLTISWRNSTHPNAREYTLNLPREAALAGNTTLLQQLLPYVEKAGMDTNDFLNIEPIIGRYF